MTDNRPLQVSQSVCFFVAILLTLCLLSFQSAQAQETDPRYGPPGENSSYQPGYPPYPRSQDQFGNGQEPGFQNPGSPDGQDSANGGGQWGPQPGGSPGRANGSQMGQFPPPGGFGRGQFPPPGMQSGGAGGAGQAGGGMGQFPPPGMRQNMQPVMQPGKMGPGGGGQACPPRFNQPGGGGRRGYRAMGRSTMGSVGLFGGPRQQSGFQTFQGGMQQSGEGFQTYGGTAPQPPQQAPTEFF